MNYFGDLPRGTYILERDIDRWEIFLPAGTAVVVSGLSYLDGTNSRRVLCHTQCDGKADDLNALWSSNWLNEEALWLAIIPQVSFEAAGILFARKR